MSILRDYQNSTPCQFFNAPPVKRCLIRFIQMYGGGGSSTGVQSVVAGTGVTIDDTDPQNPVVNVDTSAINTIYTANGTVVGARTVTVDNSLRFIQGAGLEVMEVMFNPTSSVINLDVRDANSVVAVCSIAPISGITMQHQDPTSQMNSIVIVNSTNISAQITDSGNQLVNSFLLESTGTTITHQNDNTTEGAILRHSITDFTLAFGTGSIGVVFRVHPDGRTEGSPSTASNEYVTQSQVLLLADYAGGQSMFVADGIIDTFDIVHNLGATPSYFTLTTTEPIAINHLGRTITFPDINTMRLTFSVPPAIGEDANYVWIVYK